MNVPLLRVKMVELVLIKSTAFLANASLVLPEQTAKQVGNSGITCP